MLNYKAKVLGAIEVRETIIRLMEDQEKLSIQLKAVMNEVDKLKDRKC